MAGRQQAQLAQVSSDLERLMRAQGMQAYCLECAPAVQPHESRPMARWLATLAALID